GARQRPGSAARATGTPVRDFRRGRSHPAGSARRLLGGVGPRRPAGRQRGDGAGRSGADRLAGPARRRTGAHPDLPRVAGGLVHRVARDDASDDVEGDQTMTVHFIGAGPGAADLITVRGRELIERSTVCLYAGALVPPEMLD